MSLFGIVIGRLRRRASSEEIGLTIDQLEIFVQTDFNLGQKKFVLGIVAESLRVLDTANA
jgi:hypothetical protein